MKTYAVIIHLQIDEATGWDNPQKWRYDELIGDEVQNWMVVDVTDDAVERVRIDADGAEVVA